MSDLYNRPELFESFVNSEWCKTDEYDEPEDDEFESFVNSEWCKTLTAFDGIITLFESFVNSEWCKTNVKRTKQES